MAQGFVTLINGVGYSWANVTAVVGNNIMVGGITKIDYSTSQHMTNNYGWGTQPVNRGYGNVTYAGSMEMYLADWATLCLGAPNGDPSQFLPFNITVNFGPSTQDLAAVVPPFQDILWDVQFMKHTRSNTQDSTGLKVTVDLIIANIDYFQL